MKVTRYHELEWTTRGAGRFGDNDVSERDGIFLAPGERATATGAGEVELLVIELPSH